MKVVQVHRLQWRVKDDDGNQVAGPFASSEEAWKWVRVNEVVGHRQPAPLPTAPTSAVADQGAETYQGATREVKKGWVILTAQGKPWDDLLYPTEAAAELTAVQCKVENFEVVPARRVWDLRRPKRLEFIITGKDAG